MNLHLQDLSLHKTKQHLNWVQPRTVLGIVQDIDLHFPAQILDMRVLMEGCIVHEQKHTFVLSFIISSYALKHLEEYFFKESSIISPFDDLSAEQLVGSNSSNE